jgi:hypothetical protein
MSMTYNDLSITPISASLWLCRNYKDIEMAISQRMW